MTNVLKTNITNVLKTNVYACDDFRKVVYLCVNYFYLSFMALKSTNCLNILNKINEQFQCYYPSICSMYTVNVNTACCMCTVKVMLGK